MISHDIYTRTQVLGLDLHKPCWSWSVSDACVLFSLLDTLGFVAETSCCQIVVILILMIYMRSQCPCHHGIMCRVLVHTHNLTYLCMQSTIHWIASCVVVATLSIQKWLLGWHTTFLIGWFFVLLQFSSQWQDYVSTLSIHGCRTAYHHSCTEDIRVRHLHRGPQKRELGADSAGML